VRVHRSGEMNRNTRLRARVSTITPFRSILSETAEVARRLLNFDLVDGKRLISGAILVCSARIEDSVPLTARGRFLSTTKGGDPMSVDPEVATVMEQMPRTNLDDYVNVRAARRAMWLEAKVAGQLPPDDERLEISERTIPGPAGEPRLPVRIYRRRGAHGAAPGVAYYHGGAFVLGDLETEHLRCQRLAADAGCVVLSVDYRLAPEHPYPAGVEDCYAALIWLAANASQVGVDTARLAVGGASAGGALAAGVSIMARDRRGPKIALQILTYPVTDDRMQTPSMKAFVDTLGFNATAAKAMWRLYLGRVSTEAPSNAAPARASNLAGLPAAYVMTAEFDPLRDEGLEYAARLSAAGVSVELHQYTRVPHGFDLLVPGAAISRRALDDQVAAVRRALDT
jgi:acetyl esterase